MRLSETLSLVTPARVTVFVAYVVNLAYPGVEPDLRAAIVGAVTGVYVLAVAIVEHAERKHGAAGSVSSPAPASAPVTDVTDETVTYGGRKK